jgi:hypothetical protein
LLRLGNGLDSVIVEVEGGGVRTVVVFGDWRHEDSWKDGLCSLVVKGGDKCGRVDLSKEL